MPTERQKPRGTGSRSTATWSTSTLGIAYGRFDAPSTSVRSMPLSSGPNLRRMGGATMRSEEHTSELQSRLHLVCRLLLEKKKKKLLHTYIYRYSSIVYMHSG